MPSLEATIIQHDTERDARHESPTRLKTEEESLLSPRNHKYLNSDCSVEAFTLGTGCTIFAGTLLPAVLSARHEIVLATCFWATGPTLELLCSALKQLSDRIIAEITACRVRVYICLSSRSILQKLFHTSSKSGYTYPPSSWTKALGLPAADELPGLHLTVKSLFFRPFSVLHPKYLIIDRKDVWMPSCNVSWEEWYECCIHFRGQIVNQVHTFWQETWHPEDDFEDTMEPAISPASAIMKSTASTSHPFRHLSLPIKTMSPTTLLAHPYDASVFYSLWFLPSVLVPTPETPLNTALLSLFENAKHSITILTPNFTSRPVYNALLTALRRGVDVRLITNRRMMILEQLLTSGSITEWWIWKLRRAFNRLLRQETSRFAADIEAGHPHVGSLQIDIFCPSSASQIDMNGLQNFTGLAAVATKTHVKLTMIDENVMILGSGNMDRASWYTSQELGVMIEGEDVVKQIWEAVEAGLEGCLERYI